MNSKQVAAADGPERDLVTIMAVCHTVVPETLEDGTIAYRAESPDEEALVAYVRRRLRGRFFLGRVVRL